MTGIKTLHPQYSKNIDGWKIVSACCEGTRAVKDLGHEIIPPPDLSVSDLTGNDYYDTKRYEKYLSYAIYLNVTGRTLAGLKGAAFRYPPSVKLQAGIEYIENNTDGGGNKIQTLLASCLDGLLRKGRHILVVDAAPNEGSQPYIREYQAEALVNWREEFIGGARKLTMAVFSELHKSGDSVFSHEMVTKYRWFSIENGICVQRLISINDKGDEVVESMSIPLDFNGVEFSDLPIVTLGSVSNNADVDPIPLEDIAWVNIGHFRNSADLEENNFIHGQMTLGVSSSLGYDDFKDANPNGIRVGSRAGHFLGENGGFTHVQASANQLADKLMERKERQMLMMGARLIEKGNPNTTATAAAIDATGENSVLLTIVQNIESGINQCLFWCAKFGSAAEFSSKLTMNRDFFPEKADSQMVMAAIQMFDRRLIAASDVQEVAKDNGLLSDNRTTEQIMSEAGLPQPALQNQAQNGKIEEPNSEEV